MFPIGTTTVTWTTGPDVLGNVTTATTVVDVIDTIPPVFNLATVPSPVAVASFLQSGGAIGAFVTLPLPTATDNVESNPTVIAEVNGQPLPVNTTSTPPTVTTFFSQGTTTVTFVATDSSGNVATVSTTVTAAPVLQSLAISPPGPAINIMSTEAFVATGTFSNGSARTLTGNQGSANELAYASVPTPVPGPASAAIGNRLYLIGGGDHFSSPPTAFNAVQMLDFGPNFVELNLKDPMPTPRSAATAVALAGRIFVAGGLPANGDLANTLATFEMYDPSRLDPSLAAWTTLPSMPTARFSAAAAQAGGRIYVIGGASDSPALSTVEIFDPVANAWTAGSPMPTPRRGCAAEALGGRIYVVGGQNLQGESSAVEIYDPAGDSWSTAAPLPTGRDGLAVRVVGGILYAIGGWDGSNALTDILAYDPGSDAWVPRSPMATGRYSFASGSLASGTLVVAGGNPGIPSASLLNDVATFTPGDGLVWSSSQLTIALIDPATGVATGVNAGGTQITAVAGGISGTTLLTVNPYPTTIMTPPAVTDTYGVSGGLPITVASPGGSPPGMLSLYIDGVFIGQSPIVNGAASFAIPGTLSAGTHQGMLVYQGQGNFAQTAQPFPIDVLQAPATVALGNLTQTYTGSPLSAAVTTSPSGLATQVSYTQGTLTVTPIAGGSYTVTATITDPNYVNTSVQGTLTILPATPSFLSLSSPAVFYGTPVVTLGGTVNAPIPFGELVSISLFGEALQAEIQQDGSFSATAPLPTVGVGTYPITYSIPGDGANFLAASAGGVLTITPAPASLIVDPASLNQTYTGGPISISVQSNPPLAGIPVVVYTPGGSPPINAGTYSVQATLPGNPNFQQAPPFQGTLTISPATQSITLSTVPDQSFGSPPFTIQAVATSGLPVTVTATGAATVNPVQSQPNEFLVTLTGTGLVTLTATQSGNLNYLAAPAVQESFNVTGDAFIPSTTITQSPSSPTRSTTATFAFTSSESGDTFQRSLDNGPAQPVSSPETLTGLSNGAHTYRVWAINLTGIPGTPASFSWIVDNTPPLAGTVNDGTSAEIRYQSSLTTISANWSGFIDPESGIAKYEWAIGTTSGGTQTQPFTSVGTATFATNSSLTLKNGQIYFVTVRATDGVGLTVTATSPGVTVDTSAPTGGTVYDGLTLGVEESYQTSLTTISANWKGFADAQSGIVGYSWAIGTTSGGTDLQGFVSVGLSTTATTSGLALTNGSKVFVTVRAQNGAGLLTSRTSKGVTVDSTPPVAGTVRDGTGADITYQSSASSISANWSGFSDPESGIAGYSWAIGTTPGGLDILGWTAVGLSTSQTRTGLTLSQGQNYYVSVQATNHAGLSTIATSNGVKVDTTPPIGGPVNDGSTSGQDLSTQTSTTAISANWTAFSDPESGITKLQWAIGTSPGATDVLGFTNLATSAVGATRSGLSLTHGTTYYATVKATNGAGLVTTVSSNGVKVQ
jgi:N-acetylneuraminic acid mutarotase